VTVYLSREQVLELHRLQTSRFGGSARVRHGGALEAALGRPQATFGGEDLYPDVEARAAALMHSLVMNHPFVDGNKPVGAHAGLLFLLANDVEPDFSPAELVDVTLAVARGELGAEALAIWLRQRTRRQR
jgi:death-on-curing protein